MSGAQLHLLLNHIPLFTVFFGVAALVWAFLKSSKEMHWVAVGLLVASALFGWIAEETGENAEDVLENLSEIAQKATYESMERYIEEHEEAAEAANGVTYVLAFAALVMALVRKYKPRLLKAVQLLVLAIGLLSLAAMARTANLGGQISHPEIRPKFSPTANQGCMDQHQHCRDGNSEPDDD